VDFNLEGFGPGPNLEDRIGPEEVVRDAARAGLKLAKSESFLPFQYFLIFVRAN
jgi:hypothetical protein